jgi:magnesium transporter
MLYYSDEKQTVEQGADKHSTRKGFCGQLPGDADRDVFDPLRNRLRTANSKIRQSGADYLFYSMLDLIVDNYFLVMEKLGERIEQLEEEVIRRSNTQSLAKITQLRKELIVLKRNISPVRDILSSIQRVIAIFSMTAPPNILTTSTIISYRLRPQRKLSGYHGEHAGPLYKTM